MSTYDTKRLVELLELAKLNGTEYMLVDDGSQSLKISVDTLLGYMSTVLTNKIAGVINLPFGSIFGVTEINAEQELEKRLGGDWESIGSVTIDTSDHKGQKIYLYKKISMDSGIVAGSGGTSGGSGIVVIPEDQDLPAVSRTPGTFYLNVKTVENAHFSNGLGGNIKVGSNMGLKVVKE